MANIMMLGNVKTMMAYDAGYVMHYLRHNTQHLMSDGIGRIGEGLRYSQAIFFIVFLHTT